MSKTPDEHAECREHLWAAGELLQRIGKALDRVPVLPLTVRHEVGECVSKILAFEPKPCNAMTERDCAMDGIGQMEMERNDAVNTTFTLLEKVDEISEHIENIAENLHVVEVVLTEVRAAHTARTKVGGMS